MRLALIITAALAATPALAQDARPPAYTNAEACLRENAPAAVRASSGAADAAEFLLKYLCAGPVSAASAYEMNTATLESMRGMMDSMDALTAGMQADYAAADEAYIEAAVEIAAAEDAPGIAEVPAAEALTPQAPAFASMADMFEGISVDPVTGQIVVEPGSNGGAMSNAVRTQGMALDALLSNSPPVFLRALAGRLVLELRR